MPRKSEPHRRIVLLIGFVFMAGCTSLIRTPVPPWTVYDPLRGASDQVSQKFSPSSKNKDPQEAAIALSPSQAVSKADNGHLPKSSQAVNGPKIVAQNVVVSQKLNLTVKVAKRKQVGSPVTFQLLIWNSGDASAKDVVVETKFDESLIFPGRRVKHFRQSLGRIGAQERKELALTLISDQTGRHSCRFTLTSDGIESVWKSVDVEFLPKQLDLQVIGPSRRTIGSHAEFVVKLSNTSSRDLQDVRVTLSHDVAIQPKEASNGVVEDKANLIWKLDTLRPGQGVQLVVEFDCTVAAENAYLFAQATAKDIPDERVERYLEIIPVEGILDLQIDDSADPLKAGEETQYTVSVRNGGLQAARQIRLQALVPTILRVMAVQVFEGDRSLDVNFQLRGQQLNFDPINRLGAETTLRFLIQAKALRAGDAKFRVSLKHSASRPSIEVSELTTVNP